MRIDMIVYSDLILESTVEFWTVIREDFDIETAWCQEWAISNSDLFNLGLDPVQ